ncbi:DUF6531 domain-containing protein [Streptomyces sp. NPDC046853]|uniref:DUF6531 domain-containing protein n=1 Tax=Streptomyces sp. NPDC046853 TaxID=3154920 RepID=UPI0033EFA7E5
MIIGGPILGAIVLIAALVVLADTLHKYANGEAGLLDVAFAALDCIPGMKGLTSLRGLAKGMKGLKAMGLKGMAAGVRGLGKSARGMLGRGADNFARTAKAVWKKLTDPVDLATGQMFLPQTDIELPGILPLAFARRVASDYRAGWWFGPTWSSTVDQRLEVDEQGIIFVTEDGLLLSYPHADGSLVEVLPEAGPRWPLTRLDNGGFRIDDPDAGQCRLFGAPGEGVALLERMADRNGNSIDFDYDEDGTPLGIRHSAGYHLKLEVDEGRVVALHLAGGAEDGSDIAVKKYGYTDGSLTSVTNSSGLPLQFTYDDRLRITSWTDSNHSRYDYTYDEWDRCIAEGGEAGHVNVRLEYAGVDPEWPGCQITTLTTTADGSVNRFVINDKCLVVGEIDACGGITRIEYGSRHEIVSRTDAVGSRTEYRNDAEGRPLAVTRPDGATTTFIYNEFGQPAVVTLPDGATWSREYDERGNCIGVTDPSGATTRHEFDDRGRPTAVTDAMGARTRLLCNAAGQPSEVIDPVGHKTLYEYDGFGCPIRITDPMDATTRFWWTPEGQIARTQGPDGREQSWSYDGEGNCVRSVDANGTVSAYEYTHFDLLAARTDGSGARYEFEYDSALRLTRVVSPQGANWTYTYDAAGRIASETDYDGRTVIYAHDAAGQLIARTNGLGQTVRFERDALGRVIRKDAGGRSTTFEYDVTGQLCRAANLDTVLCLDRDSAGRLQSESVNGRLLTYGYDLLGRRTSRTTPGGAVSAWSYDEAGNRTELRTAGRTIKFGHDPVGRVVTRRVEDTLTLANAFDELGRLTRQSVSGADSRTDLLRTFHYRPDGYLVGIEDPVFGHRQIDLDGAGRVTAVEAVDWTETYAYDQSGNQKEASWPETHPGHEATGTRSYEGSLVTRAGSVRYEHDALGRITLRQKARLSRKPETWRYAWDAEDRLVRLVTPDGSTWQYIYDPLGRRTAKMRLSADGQSAVERTDFAWDGKTLCEQRSVSVDLPNPVTLTWDYHGLHPITQTEQISAAHAPQETIDARFFSIVTDLVGTPTELIDEEGRIAWRTRTTLWGSTTWNAEATTYTPLRFPGQYFDPETGLHYNYFRHYDPETARYLTADPLGLGPAPNAHAYVHNPYSWADPLGLAPYPGARDPSGTGAGPADPPIRHAGPWTRGDIGAGAYGRRPRHLGDRIEIHHADQMPGAPIHELDQEVHRGAGTDLHRNDANQGVTPEMRREDTQLHWWYRSQEQGWGHYGPDLWYDNLDG